MNNDIPFGAEEDKTPPRKIIVVGVIVVVLAIIVAIVSQYIMPGGKGSFSVETSDTAAASQTSSEQNANNSNPTSQQNLIYVHIIGAVKSPGVVGVAKDTRLIDAINAAGGFAENASSESLNLARTVNDGEQIKVMTKEEQEAQSTAASSGGGAAGSSGASAGAAAGSSAIDSEGRVNINTANETELCTISGVGESTAKKIIAEREANGPFSTVDDLTRVSGIGEKKLANMRNYICV